MHFKLRQATMDGLGRMFFQITLDRPLYFNSEDEAMSVDDVKYVPRSLMPPPEHTGDSQFGCIKGRRREGAALVQQAHSHLLSVAGQYHVTT